MPFRISISGHTSASKVPARPNYGPWELSADRANAVRKQLEAEGVPSANFFMVAGRADTQPLFPDDPYIAANRRVTITLMREEPPIPPEYAAIARCTGAATAAGRPSRAAEPCRFDRIASAVAVM